MQFYWTRYVVKNKIKTVDDALLSTPCFHDWIGANTQFPLLSESWVRGGGEVDFHLLNSLAKSCMLCYTDAVLMCLVIEFIFQCRKCNGGKNVPCSLVKCNIVPFVASVKLKLKKRRRRNKMRYYRDNVNHPHTYPH